MNHEQRDEVVENLMDFVKRVAKDESASPAEIAALPEIAKLLLEHHIAVINNYA